MKKKLFSLLLLPMGLVLFPEELAAQGKPKDVPYDFRRHELSVSMGTMLYGKAIPYIDAILPIYSLGLTAIKNPTESTILFNLGYTYRFNKKFSLGLWLSINGRAESFEYPTWEDYTPEAEQQRRAYISVLPLARWNWFNRRWFSLYSEAGLGYRHEANNHHRVAWQVTCLGIEYGTRFIYYYEFAIGDLGAFNIGFRWRFGH
jgi:hypothetical protein